MDLRLLHYRLFSAAPFPLVLYFNLVLTRGSAVWLFSQKCCYVYEVGVSSSRTDVSAVISMGVRPETLH